MEKLHLMTLGFSPEPILDYIKYIGNSKYVILHTPETKQFLKKIVEYCNNHKFHLEIISFDSTNEKEIYEIMKKYSNNKFSLNIFISGGKKSIVSAAAMGAMVYNYEIYYMEYEKYDAKNKKPVAGTEYFRKMTKPV